MRVLILGGGGREHALAWSVARSPACEQVLIAPGNAGTSALGVNLELDPCDPAAVVAACASHAVDLVIVGPEQPLVLGVADAVRGAGVAVFGPNAAPARLEGSKSFAKAFMARHGIPTASYDVFTDAATLQAHLADCPVPVVVKADGLAAGKGVIVCMSREEAMEAGRVMGAERRFGAAGDTVVVEEFMAGEEATVLALIDGDTVLPLQPLQDHKRRFDGDLGPNTGGMGAYTPVPAMDAETLARVTRDVLEPAARGLVADGTPYQGVLYAGLMLTASGPRVVEFNCRFGDPECQPLVLALDSDLLPLLDATARGALATVEAPRWRAGAACCVVVVGGDYPASGSRGVPITALPADTDRVVTFHAGTAIAGGRLVTAGGRVLGITARGRDFAAARAAAYDAVAHVAFDGASYRHDIGWRALAEEETNR